MCGLIRRNLTCTARVEAISASLRPLGIHEYAVGSQSCRNRLDSRRPFGWRRRIKPRLALSSAFGAMARLSSLAPALPPSSPARFAARRRRLAASLAFPLRFKATLLAMLASRSRLARTEAAAHRFARSSSLATAPLSTNHSKHTTCPPRRITGFSPQSPASLGQTKAARKAPPLMERKKTHRYEVKRGRDDEAERSEAADCGSRITPPDASEARRRYPADEASRRGWRAVAAGAGRRRTVATTRKTGLARYPARPRRTRPG